MERMMKAVLTMAKKHLSAGHPSTVLEHMGSLFLVRSVGTKCFEDNLRAMKGDLTGKVAHKLMAEWVKRPYSKIARHTGIYEDLAARAQTVSVNRAVTLIEYMDRRPSANRASRDLSMVVSGIRAVLEERARYGNLDKLIMETAEKKSAAQQADTEDANASKDTPQEDVASLEESQRTQSKMARHISDLKHFARFLATQTNKDLRRELDSPTEDATAASPESAATDTSNRTEDNTDSAEGTRETTADEPPAVPAPARQSRQYPERARVLTAAPEHDLLLTEILPSSCVRPSADIMRDLHVVAVELKLPGYVRSSDAWRNTFAAVNSLRALIIHHRMGVSGYMDWTIKLALMASYSKHSELAQNGLRVTADMWRHAGFLMTSRGDVRSVVTATYEHYRVPIPLMIQEADEVMTTAVEHGRKPLIVGELLKLIHDKHALVSEKAGVFCDACLARIKIEECFKGIEALNVQQLVTSLHRGMGGTSAEGRQACTRAMGRVAAALGSSAFDNALNKWLSVLHARAVVMVLERASKKKTGNR